MYWDDYEDESRFDGNSTIPVGSIVWLIEDIPCLSDIESFPEPLDQAYGTKRPALVVERHGRSQVSIFTFTTLQGSDSRRKPLWRQLQLVSLQSLMRKHRAPFFLSPEPNEDWPKKSFVDIRSLHRVDVDCLRKLWDQEPKMLMIPPQTFHAVINAWNEKDRSCHYQYRIPRTCRPIFTADLEREKRPLYCRHRYCSHEKWQDLTHYENGYLPSVNSIFEPNFESNLQVVLGGIVWIRGVEDSEHRSGTAIIPPEVYEDKISSIPKGRCEDIKDSRRWCHGQPGLVVQRDSSDTQAVYIFILEEINDSKFARLGRGTRRRLIQLNNTLDADHDERQLYCNVDALWRVPIGLLESYYIPPQRTSGLVSAEEFYDVWHAWNERSCFCNLDRLLIRSTPESLGYLSISQCVELGEGHSKPVHQKSAQRIPWEPLPSQAESPSEVMQDGVDSSPHQITSSHAHTRHEESETETQESTNELIKPPSPSQTEPLPLPAEYIGNPSDQPPTTIGTLCPLF